ncbi:MAG: hypothetical protein WDN04_20730 [Rhodospirillales bacterium]
MPGLLISAWARPGYIDHSVLSLDSYATFIEDIFCGSARLDPAAVGNVEHRPDIRDSVTKVTWFNGATANVGHLIDEFDFSQSPLPPLVLSTHIPTGILAACRVQRGDTAQPCTRPQVTISWLPVAGPEVPGAVRLSCRAQWPGAFRVHRRRHPVRGRASAGMHLYRAYSVDPAHVASPMSAAAEADMP